MKVTILGTGSPEAQPILFTKDKGKSRLRPSLLIQKKGKTLLFDASPDIRQQLLHVQAKKLDAVFLTHYHFDHFWGVGDLHQLSYVNKAQFPVYANKDVLQHIEKHLPWLDLNLKPIQKTTHIKDLKITSFDVKHAPYLKTTGYAIQSQGKRAIYVPDILDLDENAKKICKQANLIIADGQYFFGKYIDDETHADGNKIKPLLQSLKPKQVWLLAYSNHWYGSLKEKTLPENFSYPNDFDQTTL